MENGKVIANHFTHWVFKIFPNNINKMTCMKRIKSCQPCTILRKDTALQQILDAKQPLSHGFGNKQTKQISSLN